MKHQKEWYTCDRCGKEIKVGLLCMKSMEDFERFMENE